MGKGFNFSWLDFHYHIERISYANYKYFHEDALNSHLDQRFANENYKNTSCEVVHAKLVPLLKAFSEFCELQNIIAWAAHGTLIGFYWNNRLLPWDVDLDFQVSFKAMKQLATLNQTVYKGKYLLDVNPNYESRSVAKANKNVIDARFICVSSGLFIDITALIITAPHSYPILQCKSPHFYTPNDIFPLFSGTLEGVQIYRPYDIVRTIAREYGIRPMTATSFKGFKWNEILGQWQRE